MNLQDIQVGQRLTYYPPVDSVAENVHFPVVVEAVTKCRARVRVYSAESPEGRLRTVSPKRLADQGELIS